jgi:hypothetical protein
MEKRQSKGSLHPSKSRNQKMRITTATSGPGGQKKTQPNSTNKKSRQNIQKKMDM